MRPPAGVECVVCRKDKQHRCQAQIYVEGEALCMPCADGLPCCVDRVGAPPPAEWTEAAALGLITEGASSPAPVIHRTPEDLGLSRIVVRATPVEAVRDAIGAAANEQRQRREAAQLIRDVEKRRKQAGRMRLSVRVVGKTGALDVRVSGDDEECATPARPPRRFVGSKPGRKLHFQPEEIERRREERTAHNLAKGVATRAKAGELLGTAPDPAVAEQLGVSPSRVAQLRKEKGIDPVVMHNSHPGERRTEEAMDEMREAVKKLGGTMTDVALGEQLGVSGSRIAQYRKELGIPSTRRGRKPAQKATPSKALIKTGQRGVAIPETGTIDALLESTEGVEVRLRLTPAQARAQLAKLSPAQMAVALGAVLQASLQEG